MRYNGKNITRRSLIQVREIKEGESIEEKLRRANSSDEPVDVNMTPEIYQERKAGVDPFCDVRTDHMQLAQDAFDQFTRVHTLARLNKPDIEAHKKLEDYTYVTDAEGNIVKNPNLE